MLESVAWANVAVDPQRITQAVIALAHNATQHTGPDDRISLGSRILDGCLWMWVSDSGTGLQPGTESRVFERFARGDSSRRDGAGLGLAIVGAIASAHRGRVAVDSSSGHGATFTLVLPGIAAAEDGAVEDDPERAGGTEGMRLL